MQAVLFLGRLRYEMGGSRRDMRYVRELIDYYAAGSDRFEAAAAKAARDLTEEQWKNLAARLQRMDF